MRSTFFVVFLLFCCLHTRYVRWFLVLGLGLPPSPSPFPPRDRCPTTTGAQHSPLPPPRRCVACGGCWGVFGGGGGETLRRPTTFIAMSHAVVCIYCFLFSHASFYSAVLHWLPEDRLNKVKGHFLKLAFFFFFYQKNIQKQNNIYIYEYLNITVLIQSNWIWILYLREEKGFK